MVGPGPSPVAEPQSSTRVATLERPAPRPIATVAPSEPAVAAPETARPSLSARVAQLPRVLLETVAWGGFAAVVALIVIALSDVGMGRAALWAVGLSGIVVVAVAVMAVTGAHLDELNSAGRTEERPD